jgi:crossover junction endodeoxyribonuclease RuvC
MLVLGLDPGSRHTGYGLIRRLGTQIAAVDFGRLSPPPERPLAERLAEITLGLERLLELHRPDCAAIEKVFHGANSRSLIVLAEARGALLATLGRHGVPVAEFAPSEVKSAVTGNGRAEKAQVARMVRLLLGVGERALAADAADALALALCVTERARWSLPSLVRADK